MRVRRLGVGTEDDSGKMKDSDNNIERRILATLQEGLPRSRTPFNDLAVRIGIPLEQLLAVLSRWAQDGTIRRLGAIVNHFRVGWGEGAMVVWKVEPDRTQEVGAIFAGFDEVSHAYERQTTPQWPYNVYAMVHGATPEEVRQTVERMSLAAGNPEHVTLTTLGELKKVAPRYVENGAQDV